MDLKNKKLIGAVGAAVCLVLIAAVLLFAVKGSGGDSSAPDQSSAPALSVFTDTSAPQTSSASQTVTSATEAQTTASETVTSVTKATKKTTTKKTTTEKVTEAPAEYKQYKFRSQKLFDDHYKKHGSEFGNITKEQYLKLANDMLNSRSDTILHKTEKEDGDDVYFDTATGYFLVLSTDGYIRTFFIPSKGIDYFNRQ